MAEKIEKIAMKITAVIAAVALVVCIGTFFRDGSLKATDSDAAAESMETVSNEPELVVQEIVIDLD